MSKKSWDGVTEDEGKGSRLKSKCYVCEKVQNHVVLKSYVLRESDLVDDKYPVEWKEDYQIIQCQGCDYISFRHMHWDSESQAADDDGVFVNIYPESAEKSAIRQMDLKNVPVKIRRIYRETIDCFNSENYTLCAAGVRAIVEGICDSKGIVDGPVEVATKAGPVTKRFENIQGKISGLHEKGILTKSHAEILHEHRYLGNEAIHELTQPSAEELKLAIDILEHTFDSVYEIEHKAALLRQRKIERKGA